MEKNRGSLTAAMAEVDSQKVKTDTLEADTECLSNRFAKKIEINYGHFGLHLRR